jgi:hypothetical protein
METARSAAGRRKARQFRKHTQAVALPFFVASLALFPYLPLAWHSELNILISIKFGKTTQKYELAQG